MNFDDFLSKLVIPFALSGGFGFINFEILKRLGQIQIKKDEKGDKKLYLLTFSAFNIAIYYLVLSMLASVDKINLKIGLSLVVTIIVSVLVTLVVLFPMSLLTHKLFTWIRKKIKLSETSTKGVLDRYFEVSESKEVYVFKLETKELLLSGYTAFMPSQYDEVNDFIMSIESFNTKPFCETFDQLQTASYESLNIHYLLIKDKDLLIAVVS